MREVQDHQLNKKANSLAFWVKALLFPTLLPTLFHTQAIANTVANQADNNGKPLETVVVTGSRQDTEQLKLTGNISRITGEEIALVSPTHPSELLNRATGVHIHRNNGLESLPSLRSPVLTGPGAAGAFLFLQDGIALRAPGFANNNGLAEANIEQAADIEVIRGPSSTVYGSNGIHGVINVLSRAPAYALERQLALSTGPNDRYQLKGSLSDYLGDQAYRIDAQATKDGGYRDDSDYQMQKVNLRHDYLSDQDTVTTQLALFNLNQETAGFIKSGDNSATPGEGCFSSDLDGDVLYKDRQAMEKNCDPDAYRDWWSLRLSSQWQRQLNDHQSVSLTPYLRSNRMEFRQHYLPSRAIEENNHQSLGLLSAFNWQASETVTLISGVDLEYTRGELIETQEKADAYGWGKARQQGQHYNYQVDATTVAPYLQADWQASTALLISAGIRYDATRYDYDNQLADGTTKADGSPCLNNNDQPVACLYQRPADRKDSFDDASPKIGINYRLDQDTALFASWNQGFRAPQTTDLYRIQQHQQVAEIQSEEITASELGIRHLGARLSLELALFDMDKKHFFFRDAKGLNVTDGETSHRGIELSLGYHFNDQWDIKVNLTEAKHQYEFDSANNGIATGNDVDTAPRQLANARLGWNLTPQGRIELEWLKVGDYYLDPANEHRYAGHDLLQLRGHYQLRDGITVFARIENLTDEKYASRADYAFGSYRFFGGQPRALHLGISADF